MKPSSIACLACAASFCGCAFENGNAAGHASIDLKASVHADAANIREGNFVTENGDVMALKTLTMHLSEIQLLKKSDGGGGSDAFDPENPPAPYENCHAGHCHIHGSEDTKSYEEIEAEMATDGDSHDVVLAVSTDVTMAVTALNQAVSFANVAAGGLPYGDIHEIQLTFDTVSLEVQNVTTGNEIHLENKHAHGDHFHTEPLVLNRNVDFGIEHGTESTDLHIQAAVEIQAEILNSISEPDVSLTDLMLEHVQFEANGHLHEEGHAHEDDDHAHEDDDHAHENDEHAHEDDEHAH